MSVSYEGEESKIPFDLDDMVSVNLMTLKNVVTFIMNKVAKGSRINQELVNSNQEMKAKITELEKTILTHKTDTDIALNQLKAFMDEQKTLGDKHASEMHENSKKMAKVNESVSDFESKLLLLGAGSGGGADMKVFEIMIHKIRKEFKNRFITFDELEETENNIMKEVDKCKEQENLINENIAKIDLLRKTIESSVDKKDFKYEVDRLNSKIRGIGSKMRSRPTTDAKNNEAQPEFDPELIGPLEDKIFNLEERINALRIQMKSSEEKLKLD